MHFAELVSVLVLLASNAQVARAAPASLQTCSLEDAVYALLKGPLQAEASSFCLKFLGGDKTTTITRASTVTGPAITDRTTLPDTTVATTVPVTAYNTVTDTAFVTLPGQTTTVVATVSVATATLQYRAAGAAATTIHKNAALSQLARCGKQRVSSACSCIATPTLRTITQAAAPQTVPGQHTTLTITGQVIPITKTATINLTRTTALTQTLTPTVPPATATQTTTVLYIQRNPRCNVSGYLRPGAVYNYSNDADSPNYCAELISGSSDSACAFRDNICYGFADPTHVTDILVPTSTPGALLYVFNDRLCGDRLQGRA